MRDQPRSGSDHMLTTEVAQDDTNDAAHGTVLVVDDDPTVAEILDSYLSLEGYSVERCTNGSVALERVARARPDLVVLDVLMPGMSGLEVLERLRRRGDVPVIMLTAKAGDDARIHGLRAGADDFLAKPFNPGELVARVTAVLRRTRRRSATSEHLVLGPVELDERRRTVLVRGLPVSLTPLEFDLLAHLMRHPRQVFRRAELLEQVWGFTFGDTATVTVHVGRLRTKLDEAVVPPSEGRSGSAVPSVIRTVWGVGYSFDPDEAPELR